MAPREPRQTPQQNTENERPQDRKDRAELARIHRGLPDVRKDVLLNYARFLASLEPAGI
jgi:hypothetical protein